MLDSNVKKWNEFYARGSLKNLIGDILFHSLLLSRIIKLRPRNVLEVGIGMGWLSIIFGFLGINAMGADNSDYLISCAARRARRLGLNKKVSFHLCDAFKLEEYFSQHPAFLPKGKFDCCFSQGFLEHFSDGQIQALVSEQLKVAKAVIISVPSQFLPSRYFGDERLFSLEKWKEILKDFNLTQISYYGNTEAAYLLLKRFFINRKFKYNYDRRLNIIIKIEQ